MVFKNQFETVQLASNTMLEYFDAASGEKRIMLGSGANKYASIIHSSKIDYTIETCQENGESDFFFLCPINEEVESSLRLTFNIRHSGVKLNVYIVALVSKNIPIVIDANIVMEEGVQKSSASLLEESILLSKNVNIKSLPVLDIHCKNIQASHGAKIYRLDEDKLFYLESKGLNKKQAEKLMISSYRERLFNLVEIDENEKEDLIKKYFIYS